MKRSVLIGLALLMGANSIAMANSDRVTNIANQTAEERGVTRAELLADLKEARENLTAILQNLDEAIGMRNFQIGTTLASAAVAVGVTFVKKKTVQIAAKNGSRDGIGFASLLTDITYMYTVFQTFKQAENAYMTQGEIESLRDMATKANAQITELEKQVGESAIQ